MRDIVHKVRYRGSPSSVAVLDSLLRDEGLRVEHRDIAEQPGGRQDLVDVVVYVYDLAADSALDVSSDALVLSRIETAIAKLRVSVPRAQAQIVATRTPTQQG